MKKTLHTLLAATALMTTSFAASTSADSERVAGNTSTHNLAPTVVSIIDDVTQDECVHGVLIPKFQYSPKTRSFVGSPLIFKIGDSTLTIDRDTNSITANKGYSKLKEQPLSTCGTAKEFYNTLFDFFSLMALNQPKQDVTTTTLTTYDLLKLRQITAKVFYRDPNSWMVENRGELFAKLQTIIDKALKKYFLSSLLSDLKSQICGFEADNEQLTSIAKASFESNISSEKCPKDLEATFKSMSEVLAVAAYQCRSQKVPAQTLFSDKLLTTPVSGFIIMLFCLNDTDFLRYDANTATESQDLNILDSKIYIPDLPKLTDIQKGFAERWLNTVLSPLNIPEEGLKTSEVDGFILISTVVKDAEKLWNEYTRHVFGKTTDVVFKKVASQHS